MHTTSISLLERLRRPAGPHHLISIGTDGAPQKRASHPCRAASIFGEALSMRRVRSVLVTLLLLALAACSMVHSVGGGEDGIHSAEHSGFVVGPTFHF